MKFKSIKHCFFAFISLSILSQPAWACLSCGCGGSSAAADLSAMGGAASLLSAGRHWLIQSGLSSRFMSGSFNEKGVWNPVPSDGFLQSYQAVLGINYFALPGLSLGVQLPAQANLLSAASWGSFGSIQPTDLPTQAGIGFGDIQIQSSLKILELQEWALALWGNAQLPTGRIDASTPANTTGSGMPGLSGGLLALWKPSPAMAFEIGPESEMPTSWNGEVLLNIGYSHALGTPPIQNSPFFLGQSLAASIQASLFLAPGWSAGLGINGTWGLWAAAGNRQAQSSYRFRLSPSLQYEINPDQGIRMAIGGDLPFWGTNSLTDLTLNFVYYQFFN